MYLKEIHLSTFRNLEAVSLHPVKGFNFFVGENAQGKTNLIEAIYLLAFGRSFRISDHQGLILRGAQSGRVRAVLETDLGEEERVIHISTEKKQFLKNGKKSRPNQFKTMPLVLFAPESILLLKEIPQARRDYLDQLITKLSPTYGDNLRMYKRGLIQRNRLLKDEDWDGGKRAEQIRLWEEPLGRYGEKIIEERREWLHRYSECLRTHYNVIAGSNGKKAEIQYFPKTEIGDFEKDFERKRLDEKERGFTLVGPHRDEILPALENNPIRAFGSQGEMRSFTLAMKLTEIEIFEEVLGRPPFLLLDDVLSELDENRSRYFFDYLENFPGQVFATATDLSLFPQNTTKKGAIWRVQSGCYSPLKTGKNT